MTTRRVLTTRRADEDIEAALETYLTSSSEDVALAFIDAVEAAQQLMAEFPQLGSARLAAEVGIPALRSIALRQFPYLVFYTEDPDAVRIHRMLHSSRDIPATLLDG